MLVSEEARPELRVREGDAVIIDVNGEKQVFVTIRPKSKVKLGNSHVSVEPLVGCLYGTLFSLSADGKELVKTEHVPSEEWTSAPEINKNNSNLVDRGAENQQLSKADIEAMRKSGKTGDEIVAALTASSATFASKTEFSQEKYKKRKAKKYIFNACVRRLTAAAVCQAYYAKQPAKIGYLRLDTLSLLLSLANVGSHANVLVIDSCGGMVTAAVAERLGGFGSVTAAWTGAKSPGSEALRQFNFPHSVQSTIRTVPLYKLAAELASDVEPQDGTFQPAQPALGTLEDGMQGADSAGKAVPTEPDSKPGEGGSAGMQVDQPTQAAQESTRVAAHAEHPSSATGLDGTTCAADDVSPVPELEGPTANVPAAGSAAGAAAAQPRCARFTSCIIAAPALSPSAALHAVLPLLAPSAPFAVYGHWAQPLAEAMAELQSSRQAVGLSLQECWWRDHQVLPSRTHPTMQMNHGGGYLLSGTAVVVAEDRQRGAEGTRQRGPPGRGRGGRGGSAGRKRKA